MAGLVTACDPVGLRRVQLHMQSPPAQIGTVVVESPEIEEALQILDTVALRHGFHLTPKPNSPTESNVVRFYAFRHQPVTIEGREYTPVIPCRARLTRTGLEVTFGEPGFLGGNPEAERLFTDVRTAFIQKYGKKAVKSHVFGTS